MYKPTHRTVNIVTIIALPEEHDLFLERFPSKGDVSTRELVRLSHELGVRDYTLTSVLCEGMGSDCAASAAYSACESLHPDLIVCLGIAGSLSDDCRLGEVCVSNEIVDVLHNSKVKDTHSSGKASRAELSPRNYPVDVALQASCRFVRSHPNLRGHFSRWSKESTERRNELIKAVGQADIPGLDAGNSLSFHVGPVVCGPVSVSKALARQLKEINRKVLAIETESGGVFRVCQEKGIPVITVRGICDKADANKGKLEALTRNEVRSLAMRNAIAFFEVLTKNAAFMNVATRHASVRRAGGSMAPVPPGPAETVRRVEEQIVATLEASSAEYKNRPNEAPLPLPRVQKLLLEEDIGSELEHTPVSFFDAVSAEKAIFVKVPRSYPEKAIAWSVAKAMLKNEIGGKQVLPLVIEADRLTAPSWDITRVCGFDPFSSDIAENFAPIIIVNEPVFLSRTRMQFLKTELKKMRGIYPIIIMTKADTPIESIDDLKAEVGLADYLTTSMPFSEIAAYLEKAFEMCPAEADAVAHRLQETFAKFRLSTHPAYFIGLQESALASLINANHRAELIELAVRGLLSFIVIADTSGVKLSRTTREEFLRELAYEIKVERRSLNFSSLLTYAERFAQQRALEIEPIPFLRGFFDAGLLNDVGGFVSFSLPYVEAFLLSDALKDDPEAAQRYFNPSHDDFDTYTFDLYCERGADPNVVDGVLVYARDTLSSCGSEDNVFSSRLVKPLALATSDTLVSVVRSMGTAAETMASDANSDQVRLEKQRLIDARDTVRRRVGAQKPDRSTFSSEIRDAYERMDHLSKSSILLATMIGSGAERLSGDVKREVASVLLQCSERLLHYWTLNRMRFDFDEVRRELLTDECVDEIIEQFELFDEDRSKVKDSLAVFITDQELRALSGPLATVLYRLSNHAGVRVLKPVVERLPTSNEIEALLRASWYMDVEAESGRKSLKAALREYRGSELFRFVLANHFMWRIFWHHWQLSSRSIFVDSAKTALRPLGLVPGKSQQERMLSGHVADPNT